MAARAEDRKRASAGITAIVRGGCFTGAVSAGVLPPPPFPPPRWAVRGRCLTVAVSAGSLTASLVPERVGRVVDDDFDRARQLAASYGAGEQAAVLLGALALRRVGDDQRQVEVVAVVVRGHARARRDD